MSATIVCIGAAHWDLIGRAARPAAPGGDLPGRVLRRPGGVALNVAFGLARAGHRTALAAAIGQDAEGDALLARTRAAGIDTGFVLRVAGTTDAYLALEAPDGALIGAVADCAALEAAGARLAAPVIAAPPPCLVADGNLAPQILAGLAALPSRRFLVPASPAKAPALAAALIGATFIGNRAEAEALLDRPLPGSGEAAAALCAAGAEAAAITDGAGPAAYAVGGAVAEAVPARVAGGVTGAGDAFAAALISQAIAGHPPARCLAHALDAASRQMRDAS